MNENWAWPNALGRWIKKVWNAIWGKDHHIAKFFGILFACMTMFYAGFFVYVWVTGGEPMRNDFIEMQGKAANAFIFAYITYTINDDIRSKTRYRKDSGLYDAVQKKMDESEQGDLTDPITYTSYPAPYKKGLTLEEVEKQWGPDD